MSWSRTGSYIDLLLWALVTGLLWAGGWLLCAYLFRLRRRERLVAGLAAGLLLFTLIANLLAQVIPLDWAYWIAGLATLALGAVAAWRRSAAGRIVGEQRGRTDSNSNPNQAAPPPGGGCPGGRSFAPDNIANLTFPAAPLPEVEGGKQASSAGAGRLHALVAAVSNRRANQWAEIFEDLLAGWPWLLATAALFLLFSGINRGLALFDDYMNLPLTAMISAGDVPPHFYLNPEMPMDYHYGLHLLAGSLVRIGGFYPWSALDLYKALSIALAAVLGMLWYRRFMRKGAAVAAGGLFVLFAGGARWLLLLLPNALLLRLSSSVELIGSALQTAPSLSQALTGAWRIEGSGPLPFPFAFISGIPQPLSFAMGSNAAMPFLALFLLLMLARRDHGSFAGVVWGLLLTSQALFSEILFGLAWGGLLIMVALAAWKQRSWKPVREWGWALLPGMLLAPVMGGVLTVVAGQTLVQTEGGQASGSVFLPSVGLRWPPAIYSSHLGSLALTNPAHLLIALAEIGPLLLLAIPVTAAIPRLFRARKPAFAGLALMALISFCLPLVVRFVERERDIVRLSTSALVIWSALGLPYAWIAYRRAGRPVRLALLAGFVISIAGGLALFPYQLLAMQTPLPSYFIQTPDVQMSQQYWGKLEPGAWVLDPDYPYRPAVLFARTTGPAYQSLFVASPEFKQLADSLTPQLAAEAGYTYIYLDRNVWSKMSPDQKDGFRRGCVKLLAEFRDEGGDFRRLYQIKQCQPKAGTGPDSLAGPAGTP